MGLGQAGAGSIGHVNARAANPATRMEGMASGSNRKTTRSKLDRERKLVERRLEKDMKRQARKEASAQARADRDGVADG
jgi:hypothetical protein